MPSANIESDPFFELLTDALRAGPGTPQWNDAIAQLRKQGLEAADEHRMLIEARENLEAGREYRSVKAGPGFTRKVMQEIEQGPTGQKRTGIPTATIVAVFSGLLILSAVGYLGWRMSSHETNNVQAQIADLESKSQGFVDTIASTSFAFDGIASSSFAESLPKGWHKIGSLNLTLMHEGLLATPPNDQQSKTFGGGVVFNKPIQADQSFALDLTATVGDSYPNVLLEAFVTTDANFSSDKGTSSRDLVWQLRGNKQQVLTSGIGKIGDPAPSFLDAGDVRLIVGPTMAIIETIPSGGKPPQRLWAGPHELGNSPRYVGVRFLQTGTAGSNDVIVHSIKIATGPN